MRIITSTKEGVLYELVDDNGNVIKEYTYRDEPVDFTKEMEKAKKDLNPPPTTDELQQQIDALALFLLDIMGV